MKLPYMFKFPNSVSVDNKKNSLKFICRTPRDFQ